MIIECPCHLNRFLILDVCGPPCTRSLCSVLSASYCVVSLVSVSPQHLANCPRLVMGEMAKQAFKPGSAWAYMGSRPLNN